MGTPTFFPNGSPTVQPVPQQPIYQNRPQMVQPVRPVVSPVVQPVKNSALQPVVQTPVQPAPQNKNIHAGIPSKQLTEVNSVLSQKREAPKPSAQIITEINKISHLDRNGLIPEDPAEWSDETHNMSIDKSGTLVKYVGTAPYIALPDTVKMIGKFAFRGNITIKRIVMPDSVRVIDKYAFADCRS